jgi:hypothetical protein
MQNEQWLFRFVAAAALMLASSAAGAQQAPAAAAKPTPAADSKSPVSSDTKSNSPTDSGHEATEAKKLDEANPAQPVETPSVSAQSSMEAGAVAAQRSAATNTEIVAPVSPVAVPPSQSPEVPVAEPPPAKIPNKLAIGKEGWLQLGMLLQGWYDTQWHSELIGPSTYRATQSTFRMRRAQIRLIGDIVADVASFRVQLDPAATFKFSSTSYTVANGAVTAASANTPAAQTITTFAPPGNTGLLQDFSVTLKSPFIEASIGQFKYPVSFEGQGSSGELYFPERAYSSRYFGDTYDMGLRLEKKFDLFKYQLFVLNGSGQNQLDTNLQKDLVLRVEVTPIDGLLIGATGLASIGQRTTQATTKDNIEFFGRLNTAGVLIQAELLWGEKGQTAAGVERTKAAGRYVILGYTIANRLQPVIRYGYLNTDKTVTLGNNSSYALFSPFGVATDEVRSYEVGLNYYLNGTNEWKLQAAYGFFDFDNIPAIQEFTLAGQAAF